MTPSAQRLPYSAPALSKGLEILEAMASVGAPIGTRDLADRLGRSRNEIFRMVVVLEDRGYIRRLPGSDRLVLTRRLFELGMRTPRPQQLLEAAAPEMAALSEETGQSSHLVVLMAGETCVIAAARGGVDLSLTLNLGYRRPALLATSGRVLLAFQPPHSQARLLADAIAAGGSKGAMRRIARELAKIRIDGFCIAASRDVLGVTDIAAPVLGQDGSAAAGIVIPYINRHRQRASHIRVRDRLVGCCAAIARALR
jgi:DNA-binding IclR family transcriptional regulator